MKQCNEWHPILKAYVHGKEEHEPVMLPTEVASSPAVMRLLRAARQAWSSQLSGSRSFLSNFRLCSALKNMAMARLFYEFHERLGVFPCSACSDCELGILYAVAAGKEVPPDVDEACAAVDYGIGENGIKRWDPL